MDVLALYLAAIGGFVFSLCPTTGLTRVFGLRCCGTRFLPPLQGGFAKKYKPRLKPGLCFHGLSGRGSSYELSNSGPRTARLGQTLGNISWPLCADVRYLTCPQNPSLCSLRPSVRLLPLRTWPHVPVGDRPRSCPNPWAEPFVLCPAGATELSPWVSTFQPWESPTNQEQAGTAGLRR
jgi:hypothetical protein